MNNLLSTVSGYFSRSLILGAFLPTIIFMVSLVLTVFPLLPENFNPLRRLSSLETEWKLLAITFATIVLSGLIYNLNNPIVRLYEGYPWKDTWLGRWFVGRKKKNFRALSAQVAGMHSLLTVMGDARSNLKKGILEKIDQILPVAPLSLRNNLGRISGDANSTIATTAAADPNQQAERWKQIYSAITGKWSKLSRQLMNDFPTREGQILPTRLGNVIRSFENYPTREYNIDAIALYPRLVAKIDKDYAVIIDEAKTSFDFMLNSSLLSATVAVLVMLVGLLTGKALDTLVSSAIWMAEIFSFILLAILSYKGAINRARSWGETVKSAFDLYRNALLEQLGYKEIPISKVEERVLWDEISTQMLDGDPSSGIPKLVYKSSPTAAAPPTRIENKPDKVQLMLLKGSQFAGKRSRRITVEISNRDESHQAATDVFLIDTVPNGWSYRPGSARLTEDTGSIVPDLEVTGANPYRFSLGGLDSNRKKILSYEIIYAREHAVMEVE